MRWTKLGVAVFLLLGTAGAAVRSQDDVQQAPILFSPDQFNAVDLVPNQRTGEGGNLLETLGAQTDRFEPINALNPNNKFRVLGRSIGRLKILLMDSGGQRGIAVCTATLIAPDRILTNYHCVPGIQDEKVEQVRVEFLYLDLGSNTIQAFAVNPTPVEADQALDYAILNVLGDPVQHGIVPIRLNLRSVENNESLFLIHHPAGQPQRLSRAFCKAHATRAMDGSMMRHLCDTMPGSSGALVIAENDSAIVGLHHSGGLLPGDMSSFNRGTEAVTLGTKSKVLAALPRPAVPAPTNVGEFDLAIANLSKTLALNPDDATAYANRGLAYRKKGELNLAIADYSKALALKPKHAEAYFGRGFAYGKKGEHDRAIADYSKAIALDPKDADAYHNRGWNYGQKGEHNRAIADYTKAIALNPNYADAYTGRGSAYDDKGKVDRAIADYDKAIEINPNFAAAYNNRGFVYEKKGDKDKAIADYRKALEIDPSYQRAKDNLKDLGVTP